MYKWITENTSITRQEYEEKFGFREILRQDLEIAGYSMEEIKAKVEDFESKQKGSEKPKNKAMETIENFTLLATNGIIYALILSRKMGVKKEKNGWNFEGISFRLLSDIYPNNKDVLTSTSRAQYGFSDAIILLLYYSSDTIKPLLVLAKEEDKKGIERMNAFIIMNGYVYDFSKNIIMKKDAYYNLYKVDSFRAYTKEKYQVLQKEYQDLTQLLNQDSEQISVLDISPAEFLCWPEKILEGLRTKYRLYEENQGRK